jgi:hypothetical protein
VLRAGAAWVKRTYRLNQLRYDLRKLKAHGLLPVGEVEGGEDGVVDLLSGPATDLTTAVQEDLEEADDTGVVDLDSGIADCADGDWKAEPLQQREVVPKHDGAAEQRPRSLGP